MKKNELNVIFSSDDNYAQHMGVAIYSLLQNNQLFKRIMIYIIDNEISEDNKKYVLNIISQFENAKLEWVDFNNWKNKLSLKMGKWSISISSYARLFIGSMLGTDVDRILYLDCDMLILESLYDLWNSDMQGNTIAAVQDTIGDSTKKSVGVIESRKYFNAGMLLIDLDRWRYLEMEKKCLQFIDEKKGNVTHHDQGVLNGIVNGKFKRLPLEYNLMTIHYIWPINKIIKYYGESSQFYSEKEISLAKENPIIIHFTPSFTTRPWVENCKHPQRNIYWQYLEKTPWKGKKAEKSSEKWYVKLINWRYRTLGV